jgi:acetyltransferase-like isoleucine patch superfamily enzyme
MKLYIRLLKFNGMNLKGTPRYIGIDVKFDDISLITLGHRVVISDECHFLTHDYSFTTALIAINKQPIMDIALIRGIEVGNNVFIGKKSIIMPNSKIGNDVIIGAGSVIRGTIPDNSIVIGNPGEVIGKLTVQAVKWESRIEDYQLKKDRS